MEILTPRFSPRKRKQIIKKLARFDEQQPAEDLSADQLVFYLIQWLRLNQLLTHELERTDLPPAERSHYEALRNKFTTYIMPALQKYNAFLKRQKPALVTQYFGYKIKDYLALIQSIQATNPELAEEIVDQAAKFMYIFQSTTDPQVFATAKQSLEGRYAELQKLKGQPDQTPKKPILADIGHFFENVGRVAKRTADDIGKWGDQAWRTVQGESQKAVANINASIKANSQRARQSREERVKRRDDRLFQQFERLLSISHRLLISDASRELRITRPRLMKKLVEWKDRLEFAVDGKYIVASTISYYSDQLDTQFKIWNSSQDEKLGDNPENPNASRE